MLFNANNKSQKLSAEISSRKQCTLCPLYASKCAEPTYPDKLDVLFLADKEDHPQIYAVEPYKTSLSFMVECIEAGAEASLQAQTCCAGRKLDIIEKHKPKMVVAVGYNAYAAVEHAAGNTPDVLSEMFFYPTRYKDHEFWLLRVPPYEVQAQVDSIGDIFDEFMAEKPNTIVGNYDGIIHVTRSEDIDAAFDWLEQQEYIAYDIETVGFRPYKEDNVILTISFGTAERVYAFPIFHPQTPSNFDVAKVLKRWRALTQPKIICHNAPFEEERTAYLINQIFDDGDKWLFEVQWEDTQTQAYTLNSPNKRAKGLEHCVRREYGFNVKAMSDIDQGNLINTPVEQVLDYNALDVKYTYMIFFTQREALIAEGLMDDYRRTVNAGRAAVILQLEGLPLDQNFIEEQRVLWVPQYEAAVEHFASFAAVKQSAVKYGKCEPGSDKDLARLFHEELGVPDTVTSFDAKFLKKFNHPIAKALMDVNKSEKIISTYITPYSFNIPEGGKYIWDDGKLHPQFNTMRTATARWSSSEPNGQNFPARDGKKYLRNLVTVPNDEWVMVAIDMAQIEYRVAASLTNDPVMLEGLRTGFDVHQFWALEVLKYFPFLLDDHKDKKKLKGFRSAMKSAVVFALIYGAGVKKVAESLELEEQHIYKLKRLIKSFWSKHGAIKEWQNEQRRMLDGQGYIVNMFGRKYFGPLTHNQMCNYPIQGTAGELLTEALVELVRMQVEEDAPWRVVLNIHDDCTLFVRKDRLEESLLKILPVLLCTRGHEHWLKVPIGVEVQTGPRWGSMEPYGDYFSNTFNGVLK